MAKTYNRLEFIKLCSKTAGKIAFGSFILSNVQSCDNEMETVNPDLIVDLNLAENTGLQTIGATLALDTSQTEKIDMNYGILLYRENSTTIKAYSRRCTHANCIINPFSAFETDISSCDCHGSKFDISGNVVSGPAQSALDQYETRLDDNILTIKANSLSQFS